MIKIFGHNIPKDFSRSSKLKHIFCASIPETSVVFIWLEKNSTEEKNTKQILTTADLARRSQKIVFVFCDLNDLNNSFFIENISGFFFPSPKEALSTLKKLFPRS